MSASAPAAPREPTLMSGFLSKKSPRRFLGRSVWQKRWVVLTRSALAYYKSKKDADGANPRENGCILLDEIRWLESSADEAVETRLCVCVAGRRYVFEADSEDGCRGWLHALQDALLASAQRQHRQASPGAGAGAGAEPDRDPFQTLVRSMESGSTFLWAESVLGADGDCDGLLWHPTRLFLQRSSTGTLPSCLHWVYPGDGKKGSSEHRAKSILDVRDVCVGRDRCMSIEFQGEIAPMALLASSETQVLQWATGAAMLAHEVGHKLESENLGVWTPNPLLDITDMVPAPNPAPAPAPVPPTPPMLPSRARSPATPPPPPPPIPNAGAGAGADTDTPAEVEAEAQARMRAEAHAKLKAEAEAEAKAKAEEEQAPPPPPQRSHNALEIARLAAQMQASRGAESAPICHLQTPYIT